MLSALVLLVLYPIAAQVECKFDESRRNDNYCDCPATSEDETETSACAPVGRFKCRDRNVYFPTSRVGDGVCDCCDGSDEPAGVCQNTCEELDRIERQRQQEIEEQKRRGVNGFMELYKKAKQSCIDNKKSEQELEQAKDTQAEQSPVTRKELRAAERLRDVLTKQYEADIRKSRIEALQVSKLSREDLEDVLVELATDSNLGTKLERLLSSRLSCASKESDDNVEEEEDDNDDEDGEQEEENDAPEEDIIGEEDGPYGEEPDPSKTKKSISTTTTDDKEEDEEEEDCEPIWTEAVPPAPTELETARAKARELREKWDSLNDGEDSGDNNGFVDEKEIDFGPVQVWRGLYKECFTLKKDKYTYQICVFGEFTQDHIRLGKFTRWGRENDYSEMMYEGGEKCYSPAIPRSIKVKIECGESTELVDVFEPSTCVYEALFKTPAACVPDVLPSKDENTCSS